MDKNKTHEKDPREKQKREEGHDKSGEQQNKPDQGKQPHGQHQPNESSKKHEVLNQPKKDKNEEDMKERKRA